MTTFAPRSLTTAEFDSLPPTLKASSVSTGRPPVTNILNTAAMLTAAGYGDPATLERVRVLHDAAQAALSDAYGDPFAGIDTAALDPADAVQLIRHLATSRVLVSAPGSLGSNGLASATEQFIASLNPAAVAGFTEYLTGVAATLNREFTKAASKMVAAGKAGLGPHSSPTEILNTGTVEQVTAYRDLNAATGQLDRLARLWIDTICTLNPDMPTTTIAAAFVTTDDESERENAAGIWSGERETVVVANDMPGIGPAVRQVTKPRLGGAWLALVGAGYKLTLRVPPPATAADSLADTA